MCSVAGGKNPADVQAMLTIMKHRAPDGDGVFFDERFSIGMGRLKIVGGDYALPYHKGKYVIAFNGEIYNYKTIQTELLNLGHTFDTDSDIEVLLESFIEWGDKCLDKFNGMFAFAIYNGKEIFVARDIAGEKPLYYTEKPFTFASEAKALDDPKEFPPAHYGIYNIINDDFWIRPYWKLEKIEIPKGKEVEMLEELLIDAVRLRTNTQVPMALYYSGGIDSELLNSFHAFKDFYTYHDKDYRDEFNYYLKKIVWHLDYPVKSFSAFGLWKLGEWAHNDGFKIVISGEGADELFGGYVRYIHPHFNYVAQKKFPSYKDMFKPAQSVDDLGWIDFCGNLRELLRMGDRMSSAWGLENRCPFLDKRIIQFAFSLPDEFKISGMETKVILRKILSKRIPEYRDMEKTGLFCSVNKWIGSKEKYEKNDWLRAQYETVGN